MIKGDKKVKILSVLGFYEQAISKHGKSWTNALIFRQKSKLLKTVNEFHSEIYYADPTALL